MPERYLGRTLGKYRIDAIIGSGGFAWVYKAFDPELDIPVALKILKPQYAGDETFEERFRREASTAAKLRHPNIIKIYSVGREGEAVYFAMDYLPQGLADRLNVMTTLPESMLIRMAIDVASALGFAHREGVIHRDVKTDNILFDEHGNAIVADFGIARAVANYNGQTGTNMVVGTPQYFSPEQARGQTLDGRADLYSLGVTLFRAATGVLPFTGEDWYEIARQQVEDKPPRPRSINPAVSRELEDVILRCLEKDRDQRYASGEELCEELVQLLHARGETAAMRTSAAVPIGTTLSSPRPALKIKRRLRRVPRAAWAGVAAVALMVLVVLAFSGGDEGVAQAGPTPEGTLFGIPLPPALATPPPQKPRLFVHTPENSRVTLNGDSIPSGTFTTDTLPPGEYEIIAAVTAVAGCPSASATRRVTLALGDSSDVRLDPRGCGRLTIDARPLRATPRYALTPLAGGTRVSGTLPLRRPLTLPAGVYRLEVQSSYCAPYINDRVRVKSDGSIERLPIRLLCES